MLEKHGFETGGIEMPLTTLDAYCADNRIKRIDLLKIDVEGSELAVLRGASRLLTEDRVRLIQFEFNEMHLFSQTTMEDFAKLLPGYELARILYSGDLLPLGSAPLYRRNLFVYQNIVAYRS